MPQERRIIFTSDAKFQLSTPQQGKPITLSGYALVWNVLSDDRGGYKVRLMPGSATFSTPTQAYFEHDSSQHLGNTQNNSLRIAPDDYGVKVEMDLPNTTLGHDVAQLVADKYVQGMSFSMVSDPDGQQVTENGQTILNATKYLVDEVSVVGNPSFTQATVGLKTDPGFSARVAQSLTLENYKFSMLRLPGAEFPQSVAVNRRA